MIRRPTMVLAVAALAIVGSATAGTAQTERSRPEWTLGAGVWGLEEEDGQAGLLDLGYRSRGFAYDLFVTAGALVNGDGGAHARVGFGRHFELGDRWRVTPTVAFGLYEEGDGADLGHAVEFRSALELSVRIAPRARLGMTFAHLSNASISDENPGIETLELVVVVRPNGR